MHRKTATWTTRLLNQMGMEGRCHRCLTQDRHTKECRDPLVCYICKGVSQRQWDCPRGIWEENRRGHTTETAGLKVHWRRGDNTEEKGDAETYRNTLMGCLIGDVTIGFPIFRGGTAKVLAETFGGQ